MTSLIDGFLQTFCHESIQQVRLTINMAFIKKKYLFLYLEIEKKKTNNVLPRGFFFQILCHKSTQQGHLIMSMAFISKNIRFFYLKTEKNEWRLSLITFCKCFESIQQVRLTMNMAFIFKNILFFILKLKKQTNNDFLQKNVHELTQQVHLIMSMAFISKNIRFFLNLKSEKNEWRLSSITFFKYLARNRFSKSVWLRHSHNGSVRYHISVRYQGFVR